MMGKKVGVLLLDLCKDGAFILAGILSAGFGLKSFLIPNGLIDGGVTGVSLMVASLTGMTLPVLIFLINLPFMFLGLRQIGKGFVIKTFFSILALALCLNYIEYPVITHDRLLISVFGGFFLGAGIGLAVRGGSVIDGTEVLAIYLSKKFRVSMGSVIFAFNVGIFGFAVIFLSVEVALYSMLIYFSASKTVDFIVKGIEEHIGLTVISEKNGEIRAKLIGEFGKGVTIYKGRGGYSEHGKDMDILFTVITRLEVSTIFREIRRIDPVALIIEESLNEVTGGVTKKRKLI